MATRKTHNYRSIVDFIEHADSELYDIIHTLVIEYKFSQKDKKGVTFLLPRDPEFRKFLAGLTSTGDTGDEETAIKHLSALIIYEPIKNPNEFKKMDELVNALGQIVEVDSRRTNLSEVVFKNGAKAVINEAFQDGCKRDNIHVYDLVKGRLPIDAPMAKTKSTRKPRQRERKSEDSSEPKKLNSLRFALGAEVENSYIYRRRTQPGADEYRDVVLSFLDFLFTYPDRKIADPILYERVLPLVSKQWAADFYILFEPRSVCSEYIIPESILDEWLSVRKRRSKVNVKTVMSSLDCALDTARIQSGVYGNRINILNAIDDIRREIEDLDFRDLVSKCRSEYQKIVNTNAIGDVKNVYPNTLINLYRRDKDSKLLEDEFRQYLLLEFLQLERLSGNELTIQFGELLEKINEYLVNYIDNGYVPAINRLRLLNPETARCSNSDIKRHLANEFIRSSNFIHIPLSSRDLLSQDFPHEEYTISRPVDDKFNYWNIAMLMTKRLEKLSQQYESVDEEDMTIRAIDKVVKKYGNNLDEATKKQLGEAVKNIEEKKKKNTQRKEESVGVTFSAKNQKSDRSTGGRQYDKHSGEGRAGDREGRAGDREGRADHWNGHADDAHGNHDDNPDGNPDYSDDPDRDRRHSAKGYRVRVKSSRK
jgi:hypothetical protein